MHPDLQRRVQRYGWDKASDFYENSWQDQLKPAHDALMEKANIQAGEQVLDLAAGTGLVTFRMMDQLGPKGKMIATDLSDEMVKKGTERACEKGLTNVTFQWMDAENLSLENESFDLVSCALGLMYFPDPDRAIQEMYRVLKPNGRVVLAVWGSRKNCGWAEIFPIVDARVSSDVCPMFFQLGEGEIIKYPMEKAGFTDISIQKIKTELHYKNEEDACQASFLGGPVAMAYSRFDAQTKEKAQQEYIESIQAYKSNEGYKIPGEFVIAKAIKTA